jgi:S1-C subfamily serine protease
MTRRSRSRPTGRAGAVLAAVTAVLAVVVLALVPSATAIPTAPATAAPPPAPASSSVVALSAVFDDGARALGSGIVLTTTGEVLTCDHVVDGARTVTAVSAAGRSYPATLVRFDRSADAAVIQLHDAPDLPTASGLTAARRGDPARLRVGDPVTAVSSRGPGAATTTPGAVTALGRSITLTDSAGGRHRLDGLVEFRAPLRHGDSGGALVDDRGQVVGMVAAASQDPAGTLGAAVPIDRAAAAAGP